MKSAIIGLLFLFSTNGDVAKYRLLFVRSEIIMRPMKSRSGDKVLRISLQENSDAGQSVRAVTYGNRY